MSIKYYLKHLSEPHFTHVLNGEKVSEGRLNKGDFKEMEVNDIITFHNENNKFDVKITSKKYYNTFKDFLIGETLEKTLPNCNSIEDGLKIYYKFFNEEMRSKYNVVAIRIKKC